MRRVGPIRLIPPLGAQGAAIDIPISGFAKQSDRAGVLITTDSTSGEREMRIRGGVVPV